LSCPRANSHALQHPWSRREEAIRSATRPTAWQRALYLADSSVTVTVHRRRVWAWTPVYYWLVDIMVVIVFMVCLGYACVQGRSARDLKFRGTISIPTGLY